MRVPKLPWIPESERLSRLEIPAGRLRVILDTDTANEIDDQFAVCHVMLSPDRVDVRAVTAAPFVGKGFTDPEGGMEASFDEIHRILSRLPGVEAPPVLKGSRNWLGSREEPEASPATQAIIEEAHDAGSELLYVVAIGAITNVANALLLDPSIIEKIVVVWLGGHGLNFPSAMEFNLMGDPWAARFLLNSGVPFVLVPCWGVASHLLTSVSQLERDLSGRNAIGTYLTDIVRAHDPDHFAFCKEIWDIGATTVVIQPELAPADIVPSPILTEDLRWDFDSSRHSIKVVRWLARNAIFRDLFTKILAVQDR